MKNFDCRREGRSTTKDERVAVLLLVTEHIL